MSECSISWPKIIALAEMAIDNNMQFSLYINKDKEVELYIEPSFNTVVDNNHAMHDTIYNKGDE